MSHMFSHCHEFNADIGAWDTLAAACSLTVWTRFLDARGREKSIHGGWPPQQFTYVQQKSATSAAASSFSESQVVSDDDGKDVL